MEDIEDVCLITARNTICFLKCFPLPPACRDIRADKEIQQFTYYSQNTAFLPLPTVWYLKSVHCPGAEKVEQKKRVERW